MMKDKEKNKKKLIKQDTDIIVYKKTEGNEREYISKMKFLADTAMYFVEFPLEKDVFQYIGEKVQEIIGDAIVFVNKFDKSVDGFRVCCIGGGWGKFKKSFSYYRKRPG